MMSLSFKILFLSFAIGAWTVPIPMDTDALSENEEISAPTQLDDAAINNHEINSERPLQPIAEIWNPYHRGVGEILQTAYNSYQKLWLKTQSMNNQYYPSSFGKYQLEFKKNNYAADPWNKVKDLNSISSSSPSNYSLNRPSNNSENEHDGTRFTRQTNANFQAFLPSQVIPGFFFAFVNQDNIEGTTVKPELIDESLESGENQDGSTMTSSTTEELQTTTDGPTEFESTTTFGMTTEMSTTKSDEKEITLSTIQSELLDKNAEIDEAVAFNIDGGHISSTQESATQSTKINKDNFYVIYGGPY